jgi:hypothetical protein
MLIHMNLRPEPNRLSFDLFASAHRSLPGFMQIREATHAQVIL